MFSRLDKIFKTLPRHTEHLETRMALKKNDDQNKRKSGSETSQDDDAYFGEDEATVSIQALAALLESLLLDETNTPNAVTDKDSNDKDNPYLDAGMPDRRKNNKGPKAASEEIKPASAKAAKAMSAYQKGRSTSPKGSIVKDRRKDSLPPRTPMAENIQLSSTEKSSIRQTVLDLNALSDAGYEELTIEKDTSFLNGIITAVEKLKSKLR